MATDAAIDWAADQALQKAADHGRGHLDGPDDAQAPDSAGMEHGPALPSLVWIRYVNDQGEESERTVTLRGIWRRDGVVYAVGWCHLRKMVRTFRADGIEDLVCLATGECPDDPAAWLEHHGLFEGDKALDYTPHALRACRDELAVLAYLGRADGRFDPDEIEVAVDYVMMSTEREIDRDRCAKYLKKLSPDPADLPEVLHRVARHPERWARVKRAARRLVDADGEATAEEQIAWSEIEAGYATAVQDVAAAAAEKAAREEARMEDLVGMITSSPAGVAMKIEHRGLFGLVDLVFRRRAAG